MPRSSSHLPTATHLRRIAVVTGTRAEFGLLEPVMRAVGSRRGVQMRLIVTGMHLLPAFGRTIDEIRDRGWRVDAAVPMQNGRAGASGEPLALARGIEGISRALEKLRCDSALVLGDRIEALAGACAASVGRRVLVHIHGGDRATGDVDDALRNAITRLSHVHLVASEDAAERLRRMGESAWRIHRVGAPGLDDIRDCIAAPQADQRVRRLLGPLAHEPYAVVVQHPIGRRAGEEDRAMRGTCAAVRASGLNLVIVYPNCDPGYPGIIRAIKREAAGDDCWIFRSLPRPEYLALASRAAVLVGNSSSGILESAYLGVPAVNIGARQDGRLRCGPGVIDVSERYGSILAGIRKALRAPPPPSKGGVYGDGRAGGRIARVLERLIITPRLLRKTLSY